mmetsp:Transcript_29394/g.75462  ORF Transcript_29394/g.75462 Transcript_29394/m.75462 type:complete len:384 (+) Transcript_29394:230-1381(+)
MMPASAVACRSRLATAGSQIQHQTRVARSVPVQLDKYRGGGSHASPALGRHACQTFIGLRRASTSVTAASTTSESAAQHLLVVDALPWIYRCHFGFKNTRLRNSSGVDTSISFGVMTYLLNMLDMEPAPTHMAVVFDAGGMTFRHEMFSAYKSQRPPTPPEIIEALPQVQGILQAMGLPILRESGVEADDVVGALAVRAHAAGMSTSIASPDKDFQQLLRPGLDLIRPDAKQPGQVKLYTEQDFATDYEGSIAPSQFIDILALAGDASDGVPGVRGVGPKIALQLVSQYGDVEGAIAHSGEIKRKNVREVLSSAEGAATARLSRELVTIRLDLEAPGLDVPLENFRLPSPAQLARGAAAPFGELEFQSLMARLESRALAAPSG